ncbi:MAG TPA: hypothetical protein VK890_04855, partial [Bacteroidia bacterium]|nr:hypothetical protein [Bacteroidia bacterium]
MKRTLLNNTMLKAVMLFMAVAVFFPAKAQRDEELLRQLSNYHSFGNSDYQYSNNSMRRYTQRAHDTTSRYRVKYKSKTKFSYSSEDSLLDHKKITGKEYYAYNMHGQMDSTVTYDTTGKATGKTIYKYDGLGNPIEILEYDTNALTTDQKTTYDVSGKLLKSTYTSEKSHWSDTSSVYVPRFETYTTHYIYDGDDLMEVRVDSENVNYSRITATYDKKHRITTEYHYLRGKIQTSELTSYDGKDNYTITTEKYTNESGNSCAPDHHKSVEKYDKDDNPLTFYSFNIYDADTTVVNTKYVYKYNGKLLMTEIKNTKTKSSNYASESTTTMTYKYDERGNKTETSSRGGGGYGGTSTTQYTYNPKNNMLQMLEYGSCMDKPKYTYKYEYYPDDETLKQESYDNDFSKSTTKY